MSWKSPQLLELEQQRHQSLAIHLRIQRHYSRLRSFSRVAREALAERDIRAALLDAGLPVPQRISAEEKLARAVRWLQRDPAGAASVLDKQLLRAARAAIGGGR